MGWIRKDDIWPDDGQHSDLQVGNAASIRLVNPDLPGCRITVYAYPTAQEHENGPRECPHEEPEGWVCRNNWPELHTGKGEGRCICWLDAFPEHIECSYDLGSLEIETLTDYQRDDRDPEFTEFFDPQFEELRYLTLDTGSFHRDVKAAELAALIWIGKFDPSTITWDGERF